MRRLPGLNFTNRSYLKLVEAHICSYIYIYMIIYIYTYFWGLEIHWTFGGLEKAVDQLPIDIEWLNSFSSSTLYWRLLGNIQWGCKNCVYSYFSESKPWLLPSFPQKHWSKAKRVLLNCGSYRECIDRTPIKYYNSYCKNPLLVIRCVKSEVDKSIGDVRLPCPQNHVGSEISTTGFP